MSLSSLLIGRRLRRDIPERWPSLPPSRRYQKGTASAGPSRRVRELGAALFAGLVVGFTVLTAQVLILGVSLTLDEAGSSARAAISSPTTQRSLCSVEGKAI